MKLMTKEIQEKLPELYSQDGKKKEEVGVVVKYFSPFSNWTWYITEGNKEGDDYRFFGLVSGFEVEYGYVMLSELKSVTGPMGLKIERDLNWKGTLRDATNEIKQRRSA